MRTEDWAKAQEPALQAARLDPFNSSSLVRLSLCYENQREYVKAYDSLRKGMALMPSTGRRSLVARLNRLREQADDMAANIIRKDPFMVLPHELVLRIMQFGLDDRRDLVLNCSFVSKTWRETLIHKCPELWGTLTFRWKQLKDKRFDGKSKEWSERCNQDAHTVEVIEGLSLVGVGKIPKELRWDFMRAKNLRLDMKDNKVVQRFREKFMGIFHRLEHLEINGGDIEQFREDADSHIDLHCRLTDKSGDKTIKTINVNNVDFRERPIDWCDRSAMVERRYDHYDSRRRRYPALESLVVSECKFDTLRNPGNIQLRSDMMYVYDDEIGLGMFDSPEEQEIEPYEGRCENCPLHVMLYSATNLRNLKVLCHSSMLEGLYAGPQRPPRPDERILLPNVTRLTLPPVSVWTIDIRTPNVQSLDFALANDISRDTCYNRTIPMIPLPHKSPVDFKNLDKLTHLGLECAGSDTIDRLEAWLSRVPNLTSLSIHGNKIWASSAPPKSTASGDYRSDPVSLSLLEALINHSESIRKLDTLDIAQCDLSDDLLVKFIKIRKESPGTTPLIKLTLRGRNELSPATHAWLHEAVRLPDNAGSGFVHDLGTYPKYTAKGVCQLCDVKT